MDIAITCITHELLRTVAGLAARHAGYRVIDSQSTAEAISIAARLSPNLMLIGVLADPDGELVRWCAQQGISCQIVSPEMSVAEFSDLFIQIRTENERKV